jgi:parvulin-like peptidyl-prolyl isomerase
MKYLQWLCGPSKAIQAIEEEKEKKKKKWYAANAAKIAEEEAAHKRYIEIDEGKKMTAAIELAKEQRIA